MYKRKTGVLQVAWYCFQSAGSTETIVVTRDEVAAFLNSLTVERETFITPMDRVLQSDIVAVNKRGGRIVGMAGVSKAWHTPLCYLIVSSNYHGMGYGYRIGKAGVEHCRGRYPFLFAIIFNDNHLTIGIVKKLGFKPCLLNYKCHFLFLPLSPWSYLLYPLYGVFFPLWYWGYFFCKQRVPRTISAIARLVKRA